jgi:outer membrane immunogenic protein
MDLGTVTGTYTSTVASVGGNLLLGGFSSHVTDNIVRVGVNYRFSGPDIPKY